MLADEVLKLLGPYLLPLLLVEDVVIVLDYLLYAFPELLDHLAHILGLPPQLNLLVLQLLLLFQFLLVQLLFALTGILLSVSHFLLGLPLKVFRHPLHLLHEKVPMTLARLVHCLVRIKLVP